MNADELFIRQNIPYDAMGDYGPLFAMMAEKADGEKEENQANAEKEGTKNTHQ